MKLTEKTMNLVKERSENAILQLSEGKSAVEIAGEIYCKTLPDKEADIGMVMAKRIDSIICSYESNVKSALENSEEWISTQIEIQLKEKDLEERCRTLFTILIGVSCLNDVITGKKSVDEIQQEYMFDVNNVSEEYELSLKEQVMAAVQASAYGEFQLKELEKALANGKTEASVGEIITYGKQEHDVKVIMAMIAYVSAKNDAVEGLPADMSLDEIAIAIASAYDVTVTAEQVEEGTISAEEGSKIIKAISTVASFMIAVVLTGAALGCVGFLIDIFLPRIIGIPLIIIAGFAFWGLFNETAKKCIGTITKIGGTIVKDGFSAVKKGADKLLDIISNKIMPKMSAVWEKVKAYFEKLKEENAELGQNEEVTVQA